MKYLIMTEGANEQVLLNLLLEKGLLKFDKKDLLDEKVFAIHQLQQSVITLINTLPYNERVKIIRVGDKMSDYIKIQTSIKDKVIKEIDYYCTLPEFEMLLIINENLLDEYNKVKSIMKPKIFAKKHIKLNRKKYDNSTKWVKDYFEQNEIIECLKKYSELRKGVHDKNQNCLYDLVNEEIKNSKYNRICKKS